MISTRGMTLVAMFYVYEMWIVTGKFSFKKALYKIYPYLPAGIIAFSFLAFHYWKTGWIGFHSNSEWAPGFELVSGKQLIKNAIILGWRLLDFGRIFVWLGILGGGYFLFHKIQIRV